MYINVYVYVYIYIYICIHSVITSEVGPEWRSQDEHPKLGPEPYNNTHKTIAIKIIIIISTNIITILTI